MSTMARRLESIHAEGELSLLADYAIRPANSEDTPRIVELLKLCLGEGSIPRTAEFWDWKHRRNPFGESPVLLAEANGELIGVRAFMRWRWTNDEGVVESVRAVDTATHPEHRGKGIFTRLTTSLLESVRSEGVGFVFNTPNADSRPGYLKMGWEVYQRVPVAIGVRRPTRVARYLWNGLRSNGRGITVPMSDASADLQSVSGFLRSSDSVELLTDPAQKGNGHGLTTPASRSFLEWRYASVPGLEYNVLSAERRGVLAAVVVRRCRRGILTELRVCQVLLSSDRSASVLAGQLIRSAGAAVRADIVTAVRSARPGVRNALIRSRLIPAPHVGPLLTVRGVTRAARARDVAHDALHHGFDLSAGDIELF